ncbi:hypothetical protein BpJC7_06340 [Weizmannia acidilactici]|uniref:Uncharacterized protein n=1 Tax=Weizmannia acidilactici TaxID=2607726 RepID=A0A5J4JC36_9BACI|nr:hypothetical protein [Weizmannia acidilactici]GER66035.1 hypothetical protein BpJC4_05060 [Weizmannia acidilactici]GER69331.1 hypothetical protein BpJC7_06340 [Weizmannia acidilactici]GER72344.1 hypothetical protein BpPP18_04110 [Weizmannia acidilactici]
MDGSLFLGIMWGIWIWATFLLEKGHPLRLTSAVLSLFFIIAFPYQLSVGGLKLQCPLAVMLAAGYLFLARFSGFALFYRLAGVWIVMTGYAGLLLFEMYDPVWILADRTFCYSILLFILVHLIFDSPLTGIATAVIGTAQGEIIYSLILMKWGFSQTAGAPPYLDMIGLFLAFQCGWGMFNHCFNALSGKVGAKKEKQG